MCVHGWDSQWNKKGDIVKRIAGTSFRILLSVEITFICTF